MGIRNSEIWLFDDVSKILQMKILEFAWFRISWNLSKFQLIQTVFISIFSKGGPFEKMQKTMFSLESKNCLNFSLFKFQVYWAKFTPLAVRVTSWMWKNTGSNPTPAWKMFLTNCWIRCRIWNRMKMDWIFHWGQLTRFFKRLKNKD